MSEKHPAAQKAVTLLENSDLDLERIDAATDGNRLKLVAYIDEHASDNANANAGANADGNATVSEDDSDDDFSTNAISGGTGK